MAIEKAPSFPQEDILRAMLTIPDAQVAEMVDDIK